MRGLECRNESSAIRAGMLAAVCGALLFVQGCATNTASKPGRPVSQIEIQQDVGFTITEEVRASGELRARYEEAVRTLQQGQLTPGIALLESIVEESPQLSAPMIDLGIARHRSGDLEAAERHLSNALVLSPDHPIAHNELGIIYRKSGRFAEAKRSYERALEIYPGYHFARRNLAVLCDLYLGDLECALQNYEAYMQTVPGDDEASIWIADVRLRMGQ